MSDAAVFYTLSDTEKELILLSANSSLYKSNPVPEEIRKDLSSDLLDFTFIPFPRKSDLSELYPLGSNVTELVRADWAEAFKCGAIRMFNDTTVSFPIHVGSSNGYAVEISIRRSDMQGGLPWYLCYVPKYNAFERRENCFSTPVSDEKHVAEADTVYDGECSYGESTTTNHTNTSVEQNVGSVDWPVVEFVPPANVDHYYQPGEFAYAVIENFRASSDPEKYDSTFFLRAIDGVTVMSVKESYVRERFATGSPIGQFVWVRLKALLQSGTWGSRYKAYLRDSEVGNQEYKDREHKVLSEHRSVGDSMLAPILSAKDQNVVVGVGPNTFIEVPVPPSLNKEPQELIGLIGLFRIASLDDSGIIIDFDLDYEPKPPFGSQLPKRLDNFFIPNRVMEIIRETKLSKESEEELAAKGIDMSQVSHSAFIRFASEQYLHEHESKRVFSEFRKGLFTFDFSLGIRTAEGVPVNACFKIDKNRTVVMSLYGFTNASRYFCRDIYVPDDDWPDILQQLADLAIKENWDYEGDEEKGKRYVLKQYLIFTYYKSWLDGLLEKDDKGCAVFNTGLVNVSYEPIYCLLTKNTDRNDYRNRPWKIEGFACWGIRALGKRLHCDFAQKPSAPDYIDRNHLEDLFLDTTRELNCDYEHIIEDNFSRLPLEFLEKELYYYAEVRSLIEQMRQADRDDRYEPLEELKDLILGTPEYLNRVRFALGSAVDIAKKYVRWNYKTAVPIYYPRKNRLSLLLPLNICSSDKSADRALVVSRLENGNYQGETILTLAMAYMDARQVCRPNSEWLTMAKDEEDIEEGA